MDKKKLMIVALCMVCAGVCYSRNTDKGTIAEAVRYEEASQEDRSSDASLSAWPESQDGTGVRETEASGTDVRKAEAGKTDGQQAGADKTDVREAEASRIDGQEAGAEETKPLCYVHICGQVRSPGVYQLEEGSRIFQVVEKAGGLTEDAAEEWLNMAGCIEDGMKILVLSREEAKEAGGLPEQMVTGLAGMAQAGTTGTGRAGTDMGAGETKVNINTASKEELMTLSGIGESRAGDIIRYREEQGSFSSVEEIKKVPGIKEAAFQKIKEKIKV